MLQGATECWKRNTELDLQTLGNFNRVFVAECWTEMTDFYQTCLRPLLRHMGLHCFTLVVIHTNCHGRSRVLNPGSCQNSTENSSNFSVTIQGPVALMFLRLLKKESGLCIRVCACMLVAAWVTVREPLALKNAGLNGHWFVPIKCKQILFCLIIIEIKQYVTSSVK